MTSNPSIFEKAMSTSPDYDAPIRALAQQGRSSEEIYQALTVEDIQSAADLLRPTYDRTDGGDGFVSLEVSPGLGHDTAGTIREARLLWSLVQRPNAMIKVPATSEGIPAIRQLIGEGINVNITLLFGLDRYRQVIEAYLDGLDTLAAQGKPLHEVASVASFFLSRIDVLVDPLLDEKTKAGGSQSAVAAGLHGEVSIALAKVAYQIYREMFGSDGFAKLSKSGARTQRLLWASTSTKNPDYADTKYVEALIGPETIDTLPIETLDAYRDHGRPTRSLDQKVQEARQLLDKLPALGFDLDAIARRLEEEGIDKFAAAYAKALDSIKQKSGTLQAAR